MHISTLFHSLNPQDIKAIFDLGQDNHGNIKRESKMNWKIANTQKNKCAVYRAMMDSFVLKVKMCIKSGSFYERGENNLRRKCR